jgi:macrolide-specific efflux system membrane fusion protein
VHTPNSKNSLILIILLTLVLTSAIAGFIYWKKSQDLPTAQLTRGDLIEAVYGLGTVTANQSYQLKIGVTTAVRKLFVTEGQSVLAGALLIKLDEGNTPFRAPFAGTITSLPYKISETVYPQTPILTLINLKDRTIVISLEQESALRVHAGQTARMSFESIRGQSFTGNVQSLYPNDNQFLVRIDVPNLPNEILPGMTGDVAIEVATRRDVLLIPIRAIQSGRAHIRNGTHSKKVSVVIGAMDGKWGEVLGGELKVGDEVVLPKE